jgi:hypothetical protein
MSNLNEMSESSNRSSAGGNGRLIAVIASIVAVVVLFGLIRGDNAELSIFGLTLSASVVGVGMYLIGFIAGRFTAGRR